jgi:hypothetical protein
MLCKFHSLYYTFIAPLYPTPAFSIVLNGFHYAIIIHLWCILIIYTPPILSFFRSPTLTDPPPNSLPVTVMTYYDILSSSFCIWVKMWNICLSKTGLCHATQWCPVPSISLQMTLWLYTTFCLFILLWLGTRTDFIVWLLWIVLQ